MTTKVLIADDAAFVREVLNQILTKHGFDVVGAAQDGVEAVELALNKNFDVMLMDMVMPKKNGLEATVEILKQKSQAKIIAFSTENSESMIMKALESGCVDFLVKPFQIETLLGTIESCLKKEGKK